MGWTSTHRSKGRSNFEWFRDEFRLDGQGGRGELLDMATVGGTAYGALRTPAGDVVALVILTRWAPAEEQNFRYKDMSENSGSGETSCPQRILDLLTPTEHAFAIEWRKSCRARLAKMDAARKVPKGSTVRFARPLTFRSGATEDTFVFQGNSSFQGRGGSGRYRIRNWREREFEVLIPEGSVA